MAVVCTHSLKKDEPKFPVISVLESLLDDVFLRRGTYWPFQLYVPFRTTVEEIFVF